MDNSHCIGPCMRISTDNSKDKNADSTTTAAESYLPAQDIYAARKGRPVEVLLKEIPDISEQEAVCLVEVCKDNMRSSHRLAMEWYKTCRQMEPDFESEEFKLACNRRMQYFSDYHEWGLKLCKVQKLKFPQKCENCNCDLLYFEFLLCETCKLNEMKSF